MHSIAYVDIENFRACRKVSLPLGSYTPLVGQNNTGKTSILEAIKWALDPSALKESDFCGDTEVITVSLKIEGIGEELLEQIPEPKHRTAIEPFCRDGVLWVRVIANGTKKSEFQREVWEVDQPGVGEVPQSWRSYPTGLPEAVSILLPDPLFIEAMDDVGIDLGKAKKGTTIKLLLDEIMKPVLGAHKELRDALNTISEVLSVDGKQRSPHLVEFDKVSTEYLENFFPGLALELDLQVVNIKDFFKTGDLHVQDHVTEDRRRFDEMGTGAQRAIQMALVQYLAEIRNPDLGAATRRPLLIDEPELYLHPQGVTRLRKALHKLSQAGFQVLFSTHSPLMLSRENAADTVIVAQDAEGTASVRQPLRSAVKDALESAKAQSRTLFELGNLANIYFSEKVVLCEGKTEGRLLPLAYERLFEVSPEADGIAFVTLGSCSDIPKALPVLRAMKIPACAIADLDFAFLQARTGALALLDLDGEDLGAVATVFRGLQDSRNLSLNNMGFPQNSKSGGPSAAEAWAVFSKDGDGRQIVKSVHDSLKKKHVWVWSCGSIEDVMGDKGKSEASLAAREERLSKMDPADIAQEMPELRDCLEWIGALSSD